MIPNLIAYVNTNNGEIESIQISQGINPAEGLDSSSGLYVIHLYSEVPPQQVLETLYYDFLTSEWKEKPTKPNPYAFWTSNHTWDWDDTEFLNYIRRLRNQKLTSTDWTQAQDTTLTFSQVLEAQTYRQALRDMTEIIKEFPEDYATEESIPWPLPPSFLNIEI